MTAREALALARRLLESRHIEDAPLEAEVLLRHALDIDRVQLYQDIRRELTPEQEKTFRRLIQRRCRYEPTAYITGHCEFYGLDLYVDSRVLIPRSGSELLVEEALAAASRQASRKKRAYVIAEVGTGSGAIAISLARHLPDGRLYAGDISAPALEVAAGNCRLNEVQGQITLLLGDMLSPIPEQVDLVVANLPYITDADMAELSPEIRLYEPRLALSGGQDGLDHIRRLCCQVEEKLLPGGSLLLEIGLGQAGSLTSFLRELYPAARIKVTPDYAGIDRLVSLTLPRVRRIPSPAGIIRSRWGKKLSPAY